MFGLLFVSSRVGLYLIIVLLFLCQQFIPLPCHLIMCCVNSVLLWHHSLPMMVSSGLLTCVDVCSFIGITAQVNTLHLGLWGLFSEGHKQADISVFLCLPLPSPVSLFLPVLFYFVLSFSSSSFTQLSQNNTSCHPFLSYSCSFLTLCLLRQQASSILLLSNAPSSAHF